MTDETEELTAVQEAARDAVRRLGTPRAEPAYRARLRSGFVSGRLSAPARVLRPAWHARPLVRFGLAPLAAAAALVAVTTLNRGPAWRIASSSGDGIAVVDGRPVPMGHAEDFAALLGPGSRVRIPEGSQLEILSPGGLMIQIAPGSDFTVPKPPARWFGRGTTAELRAGELRIMTGPAFHGARLAVVTPETRVEVTGTTLAVIREPAGTCVCVLEGKVAVGSPGGAKVEVVEGRRRFVFADGRPSEEAEMRPAEHEALPEFRDSRRALLERR